MDDRRESKGKTEELNEEIDQKYETEMVMTYEEYKKMGLALRGRKLLFLSIVVSAVCLILMGISFYAQGYSSAIFCLVLAIAYPALVFVLFFRSLRKNFKSQSTSFDRRAHYTFYEDHMEIQTAIGYSKIAYKDFFRILETKTHFYLLLTINQALAVRKDQSSPEILNILSNLKSQMPHHKG